LLFKILIIGEILITGNCTDPIENDTGFKMTVVDVGQGLAQFGTCGGKAVLWDLGTADSFRNVSAEYVRLGKPQIMCIAISHSDLDHCGGLAVLDSTINWNGKLVVHPGEDTAYLRSLSDYWREKIAFVFVEKGETIDCLDNVAITCIWPSKGAVDTMLADSKNAASFVFMVTHGNNRCLITSDIDSISQKQLLYENDNISAELFIAPHHGSNNFSPLFMQYVNPDHAVISCSSDNSYGHPSGRLLSYLLYMNTEIHLTFSSGSATFVSNAFYWLSE